MICSIVCDNLKMQQNFRFSSLFFCCIFVKQKNWKQLPNWTFVFLRLSEFQHKEEMSSHWRHEETSFLLSSQNTKKHFQTFFMFDSVTNQFVAVDFMSIEFAATKRKELRMSHDDFSLNCKMVSGETNQFSITFNVERA